MFLENVCCSRRRDRLCENSEMAFWKNEKGVLGPLAAKENAPYRNCGGRFSRVAGWRGVFAQSGEEAEEACNPGEKSASSRRRLRRSSPTSLRDDISAIQTHS